MFFNFLCMLFKDWIKELGPCSINRSLESTNEIIKVVDNIQQDSAIVVIVNSNHEVIYIFLFFFPFFYIKYCSFICKMTYNICFL